MSNRMLSLFSAAALMILASTAHAGFQYGVICEDAKGAQYLFSDAIVKNANGDEDSVKNPTECTVGSCDAKVMKISGVTEDDGILFSGEILDSSSFNDPAFANKYADGEVRPVKVAGNKLICSVRKLLSDITGN